MEGPEFLKAKYPSLHTSPEVETAASRTETGTGEEVLQEPTNLIQNYLDRLEHIALDPEKDQEKTSNRKNQPAWLQGKTRPRAIGLLREMLMEKYVRPNKQKMAEGAARVEERAAREMGIEANYGEEQLAQRGEIAVKDLERSLDNWILYLSDLNEPYPTWFRYYAFRNILNLGDYDKDKGEFTERSKGSVRLFPDIDRGALSYVEQMIEASKDPKMLERLQAAQRETDTPIDQLITKEKATAFVKLSFSKQYTEGIKRAGEITPEMREETRGKWVKYSKGTDPTALWASLQNKGTAWCTKGFATAETQLQGGDFYVYYTLDKQGQPTVPRIAIRMQEDQIGEVRGVADNQQNLESNMADIAETKVNELPGAEKYRKASSDMKRLTEIEKKNKAKEELSKDDLAFLYEVSSNIDGFGYNKDPRIVEIKKGRNSKKDYTIIYERYNVKEDQVAESLDEINEKTRLYVGKKTYEKLNKDSSFEEIELISRIKGLKTDLTNIKPEHKEKITIWEGSIVDRNNGEVKYSSLKTVIGSLNANWATTFEANSLKSVGEYLFVYSATTFQAGDLQSVGEILNTKNATTFEANSLQTVGGSLCANSATTFKANALQTVVGDLYTHHAITFKADDLQTVGGSLYVENAGIFEANILQTVGGSLCANRATTFKANVLQSVGGYLNAYKADTFESNALQTVGGSLYVDNAGIFEANALQTVGKSLVAINTTTFEARVLRAVEKILLSQTIEEKNIHIPNEVRDRIKRID